MTRVKGGQSQRAKHNKLRELTKGYRMSRRKLIKVGHEAVLHAGEYAFAGRKMKKRQFRKLWIIRLNAAVRELGLNYSAFIKHLSVAKVELDRKVLAKIAVEYPKSFESIVKQVKKA